MCATDRRDWKVKRVCWERKTKPKVTARLRLFTNTSCGANIGGEVEIVVYPVAAFVCGRLLVNKQRRQRGEEQHCFDVED
jgi:hypothetical protein